MATCVNCNMKLTQMGLICPYCRMDPMRWRKLPKMDDSDNNSVEPIYEVIFGLVLFLIALWITGTTWQDWIEFFKSFITS